MKVRRDAGFTLVELMITMVVFVLVIAAASQVFTSLLTQFKQQNKMAETHIEGAVGLGILRHDLEHAGFGLPWNMNGITYAEAGVVSSPSTPWVDRDLNDGPSDSGSTPERGLDPSCPGGGAPTCEIPADSSPPGGIRSLNDSYQAASFSVCPGAGSNCSDVLSIKSSNIAMNNTSQAWSHLDFAGTKVNGLSGETFDNTDYIIVLSPGTNAANRHRLERDGASWFTTWGGITAGFNPPNPGQTNVIYGIKPAGSPAVSPIMPFNRADYYIRRPASGMPPICAPNTGILYKGVLRQDNNTALTEYPLLSCVANLQVVYIVDNDLNPATPLIAVNNTQNYRALDLRQRLKEVRVYILAHEGQRDPNYTYTVSADDLTMCGGIATRIYVGDSTIGAGRCFDFTTTANYHWRLYNIVVRPSNLN